MLWSPSEVLAYIKDDKSCEDVDKRYADVLLPTAPYGGFKTWPDPKKDFILIAENSEIHGPNPLFSIPDLKDTIDLNLICTQILSADYQGLGNNKLLPGKNAQLLMPDIHTDFHAAIVYFFLFDSEARGFIRPTCAAYFTSDKYKLVMLAESIFKRLTEISSLLQHFNMLCVTDDLNLLKDSMLQENEEKLSKSRETANEFLVKDIEEVLDIIKDYKGNADYDMKLLHLLKHVKKKISPTEIQNWVSSPLIKSSAESHSRKLLHRSNSKTHMKDLYQICDKGVLLGLYHLHISYQYFKRKYEHIALLEGNKVKEPAENEYSLYFGACVTKSHRKNENSFQNDCMFDSHRIPVTFAVEDERYLLCFNTEFEEVMQSFLKWGKSSDFKSFADSDEDSSIKTVDSSECPDRNPPSCEKDINREADLEKDITAALTCCGHVVPLYSIWNTVEYLTELNPDMETVFTKILKLFNDSERLFFAVLTRLPIIIFSAPQLYEDAVNFIKALSIFIPRSKGESILVDVDRREQLTAEDFNKFAAINLCLEDHNLVSDLVPLEFLSSICILNLKECALTAPTYSGQILAGFDQRLNVTSFGEVTFPIIIGLLSEIEFTIKCWHRISSSAIEASEISSYIKSKGFSRSDMQIIEKLYVLWKS